MSCLHTSHLEKDSTIVRLSEVNNELTNRINKLERDITEEKCTNEKLKISFALQNDKKLNLEDKCDELSKLVEDLKEMNKYYLSELEVWLVCLCNVICLFKINLKSAHYRVECSTLLK